MPHTDNRGRVLDFHGFRHTSITGTDNAPATDSLIRPTSHVRDMKSTVLYGARAGAPPQNSPQFGTKQNRVPDIDNAVIERARQDSNLQPSDSKSATLSIELRAQRLSGCSLHAQPPAVNRFWAIARFRGAILTHPPELAPLTYVPTWCMYADAGTHSLYTDMRGHR